MKWLKNRWSFLVLGLLVGAYTGGDVALRYASSRKVAYDQVLEDNYVERQIWAIIASSSTIAKAENVKLDTIISEHRTMLTVAFLTLVELHKSGHYTRKNDDIRKYLRRAKDFIVERPDGFLEQKFVVIPSKADRVNNPTLTTDPESATATNQARKQLQEAFDYVDSLVPRSDKTNSEQAGADQPAPASEVKREGREKPKSASEVRPQ